MPKPRPATSGVQGALRPLNARQRRFVDAILEGQGPKAAAVAAGYSGWSAAQSGYELTRRANVAAAIAAGRARLGGPLTREAAIAELAHVAMSNILDYAEVRDGHIDIDLSRIDRARAAGVRELVLDETYNHRTGETLRRVRVRMGPKLAALRSLIPLLPSADDLAAEAEAAGGAAPGGEGAGPEEGALAEEEAMAAARSETGAARDVGETPAAAAVSAPDRSWIAPAPHPDPALTGP